LSEQDQIAFHNEHVDLMLEVAAKHGLQSIEGFHLLAPQGAWERWWTMRFPDLTGAEAWMKAETAPPYGRHGYYEYELARSVAPAALSWIPRRSRAAIPSDADPRIVPPLEADQNSIVVLGFGG
jgi:hypothetical protein